MLEQLSMKNKLVSAITTTLLGLVIGNNAQAQQGICVAPQRPVCPLVVSAVPQYEFTFSRLIFADNPIAVHELGDYVGFPHWQADCSDSDPHFISAIKRMTRINTNDTSQSISLMDGAIYDYPALYMVEAGFASFTEFEAIRLREYLLRGGFLLVDDFHGSYQWSKFLEWMDKIFPDREIVDIPKDHEVFHVHFDIENFVQIPGSACPVPEQRGNLGTTNDQIRWCRGKQPVASGTGMAEPSSTTKAELWS